MMCCSVLQIRQSQEQPGLVGEIPSCSSIPPLPSPPFLNAPIVAGNSLILSRHSRSGWSKAQKQQGIRLDRSTRSSIKEGRHAALQGYGHAHPIRPCPGLDASPVRPQMMHRLRLRMRGRRLARQERQRSGRPLAIEPGLRARRGGGGGWSGWV